MNSINPRIENKKLEICQVLMVFYRTNFRAHSVILMFTGLLYMDPVIYLQSLIYLINLKKQQQVHSKILYCLSASSSASQENILKSSIISNRLGNWCRVLKSVIISTSISPHIQSQVYFLAKRFFPQCWSSERGKQEQINFPINYKRFLLHCSIATFWQFSGHSD